jgi:hypothetical protein
MAELCLGCEEMWRRYASLITAYNSLAQATTEPADAGGGAVARTMILLEDLDQLRRAIDRHEREVHERSTPWAQSREPRTRLRPSDDPLLCN